MQKRLECNVTGIVQGVMFRDFARRKALLLGLTGTVKNLSDGSVSVIAEGEEECLKELVPLLWKGPLISRMVVKVEGVSETWKEATGEFPDFRILY